VERIDSARLSLADASAALTKCCSGRTASSCRLYIRRAFSDSLHCLASHTSERLSTGL